MMEHALFYLRVFTRKCHTLPETGNYSLASAGNGGVALRRWAPAPVSIRSVDARPAGTLRTRRAGAWKTISFARAARSPTR